MWIARLLLLGIVSITLVALASTHLGWNIILELLSHFQRQYFFFSLILLGLLILLRRKKFVWLGLVCLGLLLTNILPWYIPRSQPPTSDSQPLRVLISNVYIRNTQYERVLSLVKQEKPDIAVFMEVTQAWVQQLATLKDLLPYSSSPATPANPGILMLSRFPLENLSVNFFGTDQDRRAIGYKKATILAEIKLAGQVISLIATHPATPVKPSIFHARNRQLDNIRAYIQQRNLPTVMMGDLNITMWSPYYRRFANQTGLLNARQGFGIVPTWRPIRIPFVRLPSALFWLLAIPIDHCLVSPAIAVTRIHPGPNVGSDHLPLVVDLRF